LEMINRMFEEGLKPGLYSPDQLTDLIHSRISAQTGQLS